MSRFVLTNSSFETKLNLTLLWGNMKLYIKEKSKTKGISFYLDDTGWIVCVGTYIYKHKTSKDALKLMLSDFNGPNDISTFKKQTLGIYSICIHKFSQTYVFNDYYGIYDTYYSHNIDEFFIGNNLSDIVHSLPEIKLNEFPLILNSFGITNFSKESLIEGIKRLEYNEYINLESSCTVCTIPNDHYKIDIHPFINEEDAINYLKWQITDVVNDIYNIFGKVSVSMTGGLDSRLVLASFLSVPNSVDGLYYGRSNSFHFYACKEDLDIVSAISMTMGLQANILEWTSPEHNSSIDYDWQKQLYDMVGFNNEIYCGNKKFVESIDRIGNFWEFGYFLEAIRLREWVESHNGETFSVDEYMNHYMARFESIDYENKREFKEWLREIFISKTISLEIADYTKIPLQMANKVEWLFRERLTDSRTHMFVNNYKYAFPLFSCPRIHEFILNLPTYQLSKARFQIKLISALNPSLLKVPVFSHRRKYVITSSGEKRLAMNFKNILTILSYHFPRLYSCLLPLYQRFYHQNTSSYNASFMSELEKILGEKLGYLNLQKYGSDISNLFNLRQTLLAVKFSEEELKKC